MQRSTLAPGGFVAMLRGEYEAGVVIAMESPCSAHNHKKHGL